MEKRLVPHNFSFKERREELIRSDFKFPEGISFFPVCFRREASDGFLSRIKRILCTFSCTPYDATCDLDDVLRTFCSLDLRAIHPPWICYLSTDAIICQRDVIWSIEYRSIRNGKRDLARLHQTHHSYSTLSFSTIYLYKIFYQRWNNINFACKSYLYIFKISIWMNEIFTCLIVNEIFSIFWSIRRSFEIWNQWESRLERPSFVENEKVMGERGWSRVPSQMGAGWQPVERRGGAHRKSGGESWQMTMRWRCACCRLVREMSNDRRNRDHSSSIVCQREHYRLW